MATRASTSTTYGQLFSVGGFPRLAVGTMLARTAGTFWQVALVLFVLTRFHSPALAGVATLLSVGPGLLVSPIAGALLDRHGRIRFIQLDYGIATCVLTLLAILAATRLLTPPLLLIIIALGSLTGPLSASGTRSLFPLVVPRELWDRANAIDSGSQALASVVGPALAGLVLAWIGGEGAFFAIALVYALAGFTLLGFDDPPTTRRTHDPLLRSAWQALWYVLRHPTLRGIMVTLELSNVGFGILSVALPVLALRRFHWGVGAVGVLWSVAGLATVASGLLVGRNDTETRERRMVAFGMSIAAAGCFALALAPAGFALVLAMALIGISSAPVDIGLFALRQRRTDPAWFGRVFAVSMSLNFAGMPIGAALGGPLIEWSLPLAFALAVAFSLAGVWAALRLIPRA